MTTTMAPSLPSIDIPHLRRTKDSTHRQQPALPHSRRRTPTSFLSSAAYMSAVWPTMKAMEINNLLAAVTWEMIEPTEGHFDSSELDKVILAARSYGLHLVFLCFGSFHNAMSTYVLAWVKWDTSRFPRVHILDDERLLKILELISPFNSRAWGGRFEGLCGTDAPSEGIRLCSFDSFDGSGGK